MGNTDEQNVKIRRTVIKALELQAKKGKYSGKFSVYPAEVKKLGKLGFEIEYGKGYSEKCTKNSQNVTISWKKAYPGSLAYHMAKLTQNYCHECNTNERKHSRRANHHQKYSFFQTEKALQEVAMNVCEIFDEETGESEFVDWNW